LGPVKGSCAESFSSRGFSFILTASSVCRRIKEEYMKDAKAELERKKAQLEELIRSRPKANCSSKYSSEIDVKRESEIEDLEEEIQALESRSKA
jgi:hypothetical protein